MEKKVKPKQLSKTLGLFDVYAISTGAMFSSGFFLLPGIASAATGPSVVFAYIIASLLMIPPMLSMAELSTAMPKAGGAYFFLDRSLGPMMGTIGGLGSWIGLILKSAFAIVGIGAYMNLLLGWPIAITASALTLFFGLVNLAGAKETAGLQRMLVLGLVVTMFYIIVEGLFTLTNVSTRILSIDDPWLLKGWGGLFATVGMVFVSYAGLTKVASVAEEVKQPERNIPLGMVLALLSTSLIYALGVLLMVMLIEPENLYKDLTPVTSLVNTYQGWMPISILAGMVAFAALAAFASTGNAGIMAASRYLLAMSRDNLISKRFQKLSKRDVPQTSVILTTAIIVAVILIVDVQSIAKLASSFQLFVFGLLCLAVIIMRESRIKSYDPGYYSPFYPWIHLIGVLSASWLIIELGIGPMLFTITLIIGSVFWYVFYASNNVQRLGAIYHVHARLGKQKFEPLEDELSTIVREQDLRINDPYEKMIMQSQFIDWEPVTDEDDLHALLHRVSAIWAGLTGVEQKTILKELGADDRDRWVRLADEVVLIHTAMPDINEAMMVMVRVKDGIQISNQSASDLQDIDARALFFMIYPEAKRGTHIRILGQLARHLEQETFKSEWLKRADAQDLRELLVRDDRYLMVHVDDGLELPWIGKTIGELDLPGDSLITLINRGGHWVIPHGHTVIESGDTISVIGNPDAIQSLRSKLR